MKPFKDKRVILDSETVKDTLASAIKKPLTVQKKPVKFTWDGLLNFGVSLSNTPLRQYNIASLINNTYPEQLILLQVEKNHKKKIT